MGRYNRSVKLVAFALAAVALLSACRNAGQNKEAVRQGIMDYLAKRTDLVSMDVNVTSVSFRKDEADANVHFQAKGTNAPGSGMDMRYVLEQKNGRWVVKGRQDSGASPHGAATPADAMPSQGLPPGHPPVDAGASVPPPQPSAGSPR